LSRNTYNSLSNLAQSDELSSFTDQPDVITHVALVKPKPGVFIDEITSILVICTPISVLLLGVSAISTPGAHPSHKEIRLYATEMSVQTEVEMTSVIGTPEGRIFMCGLQDGDLYELHYQEKEGWFEKRVQLVNHSVGGVQSFLPRFSAGKTDGKPTNMDKWAKTQLWQIELSRSSLIITETDSTRLRQTILSLSIRWAAKRQYITSKPYQICTRLLKTKLLGHLLSLLKLSSSTRYT
jgi:hypothetical protein